MSSLSSYGENMLKDTKTGSTYERDTRDGVVTTIKVEHSPLRDLAGKSFVTLRPLVVMVDDDKWEPVFGLLLKLDGGTEITVRSVALEKALEDIENQGGEAAVLIPATVHDPYLPCVHVLVHRYMLGQDFEDIKPGLGPRQGIPVEYCRHRGEDLIKTECRSCFLRWWRNQAIRKGVE